MSYKGGRCCCPSSRGGLGQGAEDPGVLANDIANDIVRVFQMFQGALQRLPSGNAALAREAMLIQNWFNGANADMSKRDFRNARIKVNTLYELVMGFSKRVGEATIPGAAEQRRAEAGGSALTQVLSTFGLIPETGFYRPDVPAADAIGKLGWLIPAAAGVALFFATRK